MVRDDRDSLKGLGIVCFVFAGLIGLLPLGTFLADLQRPASVWAKDFLNSPLLTLLFWLSLLLLRGRSYLVQAPRWHIVNYRRQTAAVWGFAARVPLAQPHPLPNIGALPLPFTIKLRPNWPLFLAPLCGIAGLFLLIQTGFNYPGTAVLSWIAGAGIGLTVWVFFSQKVEITQEGLTVRHMFYDWWETDMRWDYGKRTIRWSDARLFAVRDGKPSEPAVHYELSSPYEVVKWRRIRHAHWWSLYRPAIPFAEYDAQMEGLIALISGLTGLPLYDVR